MLKTLVAHISEQEGNKADLILAKAKDGETQIPSLEHNPSFGELEGSYIKILIYLCEKQPRHNFCIQNSYSATCCKKDRNEV